MMSDLLGGKEWNKENKSNRTTHWLPYGLPIVVLKKWLQFWNSLNTLVLRIVFKENIVYFYPCMSVTHRYWHVDIEEYLNEVYFFSKKIFLKFWHKYWYQFGLSEMCIWNAHLMCLLILLSKEVSIITLQPLFSSWFLRPWSDGPKSLLLKTLSWWGPCSCCSIDSTMALGVWSGLCQRPTL